MSDSSHDKQPRMDTRLAERLARKKALLDSYRPLPRDTVRRLNEDLRVFLTYHSNAIEGNSLTLRETQMVVDYGITVDGHPLREYLEATNHAEAYMHLTTLVQQQGAISIETILTLHGIVMDKILETTGQFRTVPVYIRGANMIPPLASQVASLMREWVVWIDGEGKQYEPILRATIVDYLGWLVRQGRVEAVKRRGRWYSTKAAIERYKAEAEAGKTTFSFPVIYAAL